MSPSLRKTLDRMFHPKGIAVFGAVQDPGKFGHRLIQSLVAFGYSGPIFPVHPAGGEVLGLTVYPDLKDVKSPVDLACVCVPADYVPKVLIDCLEFGVHGAQILSSGFAETGQAKGMRLQDEIAAISKKGLRILGPNCFGIYCPKGGITLITGYSFPKEAGPVAMISQSGGVATEFGLEARTAGFGVSKVISYGNGCDLGAVDLLEYLAEDPDTGYVAAYIEGVGDGQRFMKVLQELASRKPVVIWKGGLTPLGRSSVRSHTGSLGGSRPIWKGAFSQTGAIAVNGMDEMMDTMTALVHLKSRGKRVALVGGSGASSVYTSDLAYDLGLELPQFPQEIRQKLDDIFPWPGNNVKNPVDPGSPVMTPESINAAIGVIITQAIHVMVLVIQIHALAKIVAGFMKMGGLPIPDIDRYLQGLLDAIVQGKTDSNKDFVVVMENRANLPEDLDIERASRTFRLNCHSAGVPVYPNVERALRAIKNTSK